MDNINNIARSRWLKKNEIIDILTDPLVNGFEIISDENCVKQRPIAGTICIYDRNKIKKWRQDGYIYKKADTHVKLKIDKVDVLHCTYGHSTEDSTFQRRAYYLLGDVANINLVLVHYRGNVQKYSERRSKLNSNSNSIVDVIPKRVIINSVTRISIILSKQYVSKEITIFVGNTRVMPNYVKGNVICINSPILQVSCRVPLEIIDAQNKRIIGELEYVDNIIENNIYVDEDPISGVSEKHFILALIDVLYKEGISAEYSLMDIVKNAINGDGDDLLEILILESIKQNATILLDCCKIDMNGYSILHYISGLGYVTLLSYLIDNHLCNNINCSDKEGRTPLHIAAVSGDARMVSALLSYGADDKLLDESGSTAVGLAMKKQIFGESELYDIYAANNMIGSESDNEYLSTSMDIDDQSDDSNTLNKEFGKITLEDMGINMQDVVISDEAFNSQVLLIQRKIRWWLFRRHRAAKKLQAAARGMLARRSMKRHRESAKLIQSVVRQWQHRKKFKLLKKATVQIQERFLRRHERDQSTAIEPPPITINALPMTTSETVINIVDAEEKKPMTAEDYQAQIFADNVLK